MKTLLVIAFVFGYDYQGYIPIFCYSLYKSYPEYDVRVYVDRNLKRKYLEMMKNIPGYGDEKYKIIKIDEKIDTFSAQQKKAYRWLKFENDYLTYRYVYIGDIDIFMCRENTPLHKQHIMHMNSQKTIFSNIVRDYDDLRLPFQFGKVFNAIVYKTMNRVYKKFLYHKRLSGLHFVKTKPYYEKTKKYREKYMESYSVNAMSMKLISFDMKRYTNEALLYKIVKKSKMHLPEQVSNNSNVLWCTDEQSNEFRPYHGIHFGIWRENGRVDKVYQKFLVNKMNTDYYNQFIIAYLEDPVFKEMIDNNNRTVKTVISNMMRFYQKCEGVNYGNR